MTVIKGRWCAPWHASSEVVGTGIGKPLHITAHTFRYSRCITVQTICHSIGYALIIPPPVFALQTLSWSQIKIRSTLEPRSIFQIRLDEEANPWSHDRLASMLANEIMQLLQKSAFPTWRSNYAFHNILSVHCSEWKYEKIQPNAGKRQKNLWFS